ncbi:MAG: hypothetical protein O2899_02035, partial [Bacteroidetes bacterium]|nr:hypothetical protein [Bacteroidota bacterium]
MTAFLFNDKRIMKTLTSLLFAVLLVLPARGQSLGNDGEANTITKVGTTAAQFLKLGVGARAVAMGGSFVAESSDLSALYWNPAGLSKISGGALSL